MTQSIYPSIRDESDIFDWVREVNRIRLNEDVPNFTNLPQQYVRGRVTERVPSTPSDVLASDNENDVVTDAANGFEYKLVDNAGTLVWDRRTLNISW